MPPSATARGSPLAIARQARPVAARHATSSVVHCLLARGWRSAAAMRSTLPVEGTTTVAMDRPQSSSILSTVTGSPRAGPQAGSISARKLLCIVEVEEKPLVLGERLGREPLADSDDRSEF